VFDALGWAGLINLGLALLCLFSIWLCQLAQSRVDEVSKEMITDSLRLGAEIRDLREETLREIKRVRADMVGHDHASQLKRARDSLH